MSLSKITLIGMQQYFLNIEQSLFDNLTVPEGIDKDTLVDNILLEGGEFEVLYGNPEFVRNAIGVWSKKWQRTFEKWVAVLAIDYSPLENYDRIEDWEDQLNKGVSTSARRDSGNTRTFNNQDKRTIDTEDKRTLDTTRTSEDEVSAFDSSAYQPSSKSTTDDDGTDTLTHSGTDTMDYSGTIKDEFGEGTSGNEKENSKSVHGGRVHGNIGTMTTQKMLEDEINVQRFNLIDQITDLFLQEFCIMVYE